MIPKGNEIRELTPAQREQADSFLVTAKRNRIECLFRGEKRARLGDRLCKNKEASWGSIAEGLFYFGEKGKHFWRADAILHQEECMRWKCITRNISDLSEECFDHVLQQIDSVMRLETDETRAFCRKNSDLARCCASVEGRRGLVDLFQCLPSRTKRWVRDLFIYVIHNFSNEWFSSYTPFVSTTPSAGRAERFAISKSREGDGPCVIYLFLPNSRSDTTLNWELRSSDLEKESGKLRELAGSFRTMCLRFAI